MARAVLNRLIVARHNEDLAWLKEIPDGWRATVVQKNQHLPNEGREGASFFWAMHHLRLSGVVAFVQGNPFQHCPGLFDRLTQPITGFTWLGDSNHHTDGRGSPHHPGLPVDTLHERWLGKPHQGLTRFAAGGQFAIPATYLARYSKVFYEEMQVEAMSVEQAPWVLERLWEAFFGD